MFTKVAIALIGAIIGWAGGLNVFQATTYSSERVGEEIFLAEMELADTYACPQFDQVAAYLQYGLSDETSACSPFIWNDVEHAESLGTFPMEYLDAFDMGTVAAIDNSVEVFRVKIGGVQLFAIKDLIDEHAFDQPIGLLGGVAYDLWEDSQSTT
jgi:hypothetical protein